MGGHITLSNQLGNFVFDSHVILSKAKLIRDSITGQYFNPSDGIKIKSVEHAKNYISNHVAGKLDEVPFDLVFKI